MKRRVGLIENDRVLDVTAFLPDCPPFLICSTPADAGLKLAEFVTRELGQASKPPSFAYEEMLATPPDTGRASCGCRSITRSLSR